MEINKKNRTQLKDYFLKNKIPTQQEFADFIDAGINQAEDGIAKVQGNPLAVEAIGEAVGTQEVLDLYKNFNTDTPDWSLNLNPRVNPEEPDSNQHGLNIKDATGKSRLFIKSANVNIGVGTIEPESKMTIMAENNQTLLSIIDTSQQHTKILEVTQEKGDGILAIRGTDSQAAVHLNGSIEKPSFFLGNLGVGTNDPKAKLQVSGENTELKITNTAQSNDTSAVLSLENDSLSNSWEIGVKKGNGNLEFFSPGNASKKIVMKNDGRLELSGGVLVGTSNRADHLEIDGALYRQNGQVYLTVDDNLFIRDKDSGSKMHFNTNNGRVAIGGINPLAPLTIVGSGKEKHPNVAMHITNQTILFGGNNAGKQENSAKISAGTHEENSLNIVGMASGTSNVDRKVDIWAEGGMTVRGRIKTPINNVVAFSASISIGMSGNKNFLVFGQVHYNYGNHFKENKYFIAPVKGLYVITICLRSGTDSGTIWYLRLNDTGFINGSGTAETAERSMISTTKKYHSSARSITTLLAAGDKVHIHQTRGGADSYSSGFEGRLLQELTE